MNQIPKLNFDLCGRLQRDIARINGDLIGLNRVWTQVESPYEGPYNLSQEVLRAASISQNIAIYACELAQTILKLKNIKPVNQVFSFDDNFVNLNSKIVQIIQIILNFDSTNSKMIIVNSDDHFKDLIQNKIEIICAKLRRLLSSEASAQVPSDETATFQTIRDLWSMIDLNLFIMSSSLNRIAQKNLLSLEAFAKHGSSKVLWAEAIIQDLESAKEDIYKSLVKEILILFKQNKHVESHMGVVNRINQLVLDTPEYSSIREQWSQFYSGFKVKSVGEICVEFCKLQEKIDALGLVRLSEPQPELGRSEPIEESKNNSPRRSDSDDESQKWQSLALKGAVFLRNRRESERQEHQMTHLPTPTDPDVASDVLSSLPQDKQIELFNKQKGTWSLSMFRSVLSNALAPAAIWNLLQRAIREKNIEAQKLFLQSDIYLILKKKYPGKISDWIQKADLTIKKEYNTLSLEIDQAF